MRLLMTAAALLLGMPGAFPAQAADETPRAQYLRLEKGPAGGVPVTGLSKPRLSALYRAAYENPVARLDVLEKYDPTGAIGFCFGRAMTSHLLARKMGLSRSSLAKIFIVGDLRSDGAKPEWRFHVTTIAKGTDGVWYAIDPIMYEGGPFRPLTAAQWIASVRSGWDSWQAEGAAKARLYVVNADAVLPDLRVLPDPEDATKLIQLNFDPAAHGFKPSAMWKKRFGLPADSQEQLLSAPLPRQREFFLSVNEPEADRFDFESIRINADTIPYNGYFAELLADLSQRATPAPRGFEGLMSASPGARAAFPVSYRGPKAGGFNLELLLKR